MSQIVCCNEAKDKSSRSKNEQTKCYLNRFWGWDNIFISILLSRSPRLPQLFRKIQMHRLQRSSKPCRGFQKWTSHQHGGELNSWPPKPTFLIEMFYLFFCIVYLFTRAFLFFVGFVPFPFSQRFYYNVESLLLETSVFCLLLQHLMTMNFFD